MLRLISLPALFTSPLTSLGSWSLLPFSPYLASSIFSGHCAQLSSILKKSLLFHVISLLNSVIGSPLGPCLPTVLYLTALLVLFSHPLSEHIQSLMPFGSLYTLALENLVDFYDFSYPL